jgi:Skp family chaperone for outer membrane proteins
MRIAVFDVVRILDETKEGKAGALKLQEMFEAHQKELGAHAQPGAKDKARTFGGRAVEERARAQEQERERVRGELRDTLLRKVQAVAERLGHEQNVDMVIARPSMLFYVKPELDFTDRIMAALG